MMLSQLTRFAKRLWARRSSAAHQVRRHLTQPASSNLATGTLADLPRRRSELLTKNALLRQQLAESFNPSRPHQGLAQQTPVSAQLSQATVATGKGIARPTSPTAPGQLLSRQLMAVPVLNGLHHSYAWVT